MRVLILGGDGYLGWPTAMHFSNRDHEVHVVDNYLRRSMHSSNGSDSLTPIGSLTDRLEAWHDVSGRKITHTIGDLTDYDVVEAVFDEFQPEAIVHYGEQPSAPYSMGSRQQAIETQINNV
ncbi:MAG: NAD-dependent epimerase/dehydratase family protein, partial [Thermoleophilia bacterium]